MNLNGKLRKNWGGQTGDQAKIWGGHGPPRPPLRIATAVNRKNKKYCAFCRQSNSPAVVIFPFEL